MKRILKSTKIISVFILLNGLSNSVFAQANVNPQVAQTYNIPPGSVLAQKLTITDYSYKLNSLSSKTLQKKDVKFSSFFEGLNLEDLKLSNTNLYRYYSTAENYYSTLSTKVKSNFTLEELWHIYMFDAKLKETLLGIK